MVKRYTYLLKNKTTGLFYYGVKYGRNSDPETFWITYFTSSKYVKELINKYGKDDFEFEIRKVGFKTSREARAYESKVLRRLRAIERNDFINRFDGSTEWYNGGGYKLSDEQRRNRSKSKKNTKVINNGEVTKRISQNELDDYLSSGWIKGFHGEPLINYKGKIKIRKDNVILSIYDFELDEYLNNGWMRGDGNSSIRGCLRVTNGDIDKDIPKELINEFLKNNKEFYLDSVRSTTLNRKAVNKYGIVKYIIKNEIQQYLNDGWSLGTGKHYINPNPKRGYNHRKIMCPYCSTEGGAGVMKRWHFDRCKMKGDINV